MLTAKGRQLLWQQPKGFAASHCRRCATGGRVREPRAELTVCLLDREPVLADMTGCDHYEEKETA